MRIERRPSRRLFLTGAATAAGALAPRRLRPALAVAGVPERALHRRGHDDAGAAGAARRRRRWRKEFPEADISPDFKANGSTDPDDPAYQALAANGFADWRLKVGGLVERPASNSRSPTSAPCRRARQITRHDCVEGWSCIGKWTGVPARQRARRGRAQAEGALHRLHLRRRAGEDARRQRPLLRDASTSRTPSTRRRSSPTT